MAPVLCPLNIWTSCLSYVQVLGLKCMQGASRPAAMRHLARTYGVTTEEGADTVRRDKMTEAQEEPTLWVTNKRRPRKVMWLGKLATLVYPCA